MPRARRRDLTRFVIHIGPHKTGSTYLQHMLDAMQVALRERGIIVPSIWNAASGDPGHARLVRSIRQGDISVLRDQVREILAQRPLYVVISAEGLSTFNNEQIVQLYRLLGSESVQVVHYVRRWPDRLPSAWQEFVKQGHKTTLPEYLVSHMSGNGGFATPDTTILGRFSSVFGADRLKVVSYTSIVECGQDIANHFFASFLDAPDLELPDIGRPNRSISIFDAELIRALNGLRTPRDDEWSTAVRDWYLPDKERLMPASLLDAMRESVGSLHLDEAAPWQASHWRDILDQYGSCLVPPWNTRTLHDLRDVYVPFVRQDYLLEWASSKVLGKIYETFLHDRQVAPPGR